MRLQTQLKDEVLLMILQDITETLVDVKGEQGVITNAISRLSRKLETIDVNTYINSDAMSVDGIKRRMRRIEFLEGFNPNKRTILKTFEEKLRNIITISHTDIANNEMFSYKNSGCVWELMTFSPRLKIDAVKLMKSIEEEYKVPEALYTVDQVKSIDVLKRTFDTNIVKLMDDSAFTSWCYTRESDFVEMYSGSVGQSNNDDRRIYKIVAKISPEYITEKQLPFIEEQELKNIICRIMAEERKNKNKYYSKYSYYPFVDRIQKERPTVTDRFIETTLRAIIV